MTTDATPPARRPIETIVLLAVAAFFYVAMLLSIRSSASGDGAYGAAMAWLFMTAALWIALIILLIVGGVMGEMPRWVGWSAIVFLPMAGAALLVSGDFYSRHRGLPALEPAVLPLLIAFYAVWARLPRLYAKLLPGPTSYTVWGAVAAISLISFGVAANY